MPFIGVESNYQSDVYICLGGVYKLGIKAKHRGVPVEPNDSNHPHFHSPVR